MLLAITAFGYLWRLGDAGWANDYYSAAVQAGTQSWKAFFFGSFDASNFITVDKTPAALWVMELSARLFGVNSWSILVPQALEGVAAVALLYAAVRRWFGPAAGLLSAAVFAVTPVAALMFRFNNPDALLVLLLVAAAYATVRAAERAGTRWLLLAGALVGFAFLAKMLQALLVVPALALVYLVAAPTSLRRRLAQLLGAGLALVIAGGWWVAVVELWPAASRPYIGGSTSNNVLELALGYNGLSRLTGNQNGPNARQGGWLRMFGAEVGGQVAWLLPAALILLLAGLVLRWRAPRIDRARAALMLWGGWLLVTAVVFSFMQGIFHAYYTVALAPAIGAAVGIGSTLLWRNDRMWARLMLAAAVAVTAVWSYVLLGRSADFLPWLRLSVLVVGLVSAAVLVFARRLPKALATTAITVAAAAALAGPVAYTSYTVATPHNGPLVSAGPTIAGAVSGPGSFGTRTGTRSGPGGLTGPGDTAGSGGASSPAAGGAGLPTGGPGTRTVSADVVTRLQTDASSYRWAAATIGANGAAGYQLASGVPVMAIGGFNGGDAAPTLAQFQQYVAQHQIHYFIAGAAGGGPGGGSGPAQEIASWVAQHFTAQTVDGVTVYDLTAATS
jgi:4-amino-4-deoxy-L-arabinose transferase-like glycosyltransferase